jgi:RNA polymerase sigma factor (sigma-70 family)
VTHDGAPDVRAGPEPTTAQAQAPPPPEDFGAVYDEHFSDIYRYIAGRLGRDVADDIAADTFVIALRRRHSFDPGRGGIRPWLFGIATRLVAQHRRQETRRFRALARAGAEEVTDGHETRVVGRVTAEGLAPELARAIGALSRGDRDVLLLNALCDLSHEQIAQALGIPYGTVGSRLNRARRKVRSALGEEGHE